MKKLWWVSENGQGSLLMAEAEEITGEDKAIALETLLSVCSDGEQQQGILRGRFEVEELVDQDGRDGWKEAGHADD